MEIFNTILFVSSLMITTAIQIFYKIQTILVDYVKENLSLMAVLNNSFINLCHHQQDFNMAAEWIFFATSHGKSPCNGVGGFVKHVAKRSLQDPYMTKF